MTETKQDNRTTEQKLKNIRKQLTYYSPHKTFGRDRGRIEGWYYTEPSDVGRIPL